MRLLEETKNKRLKTLLEQTDAYLNSIGALVARHQEEEEEEDKREAEEKAKLEAESKGEEDKGKEVDANAEGGEAKEGEGKEPEGGAAKGKTVKTYYTMVHKVEEEVKKQPEMLVGGQLKPYQVANELLSLH
jgi:ATP-dependent helicase STH1/SNF2